MLQLKVTAVAAGLAFPHAAQAIQIVRRRRPPTGNRSKNWSTQTVYAITSLTVIQARPAEFASIVRGWHLPVPAVVLVRRPSPPSD